MRSDAALLEGNAVKLSGQKSDGYRDRTEGVRTARALLARRQRDRGSSVALASVKPRRRLCRFKRRSRRRATSRLFGWKIAATSLAGQKHIGVDGPLAGRLLAETVHSERRRHSAWRQSHAGRGVRVCVPYAAAICRHDKRHTSGMKCLPRSRTSISRSKFRTRAMPTSSRRAGRRSSPINACAHRFVLGPPAPPIWRALDLGCAPRRREGRRSIRARRE